jgi:predicted nucleotidyltransferase
MEYRDVFRALQLRKVKYLLCGGLAVNIYGIPRMTADIDLLLEFNSENIERFTKAIEALKYSNLVPIELKTLVDAEIRKKLISEKNLVAYSFYNSLKGSMNVDVLLDVPIPFEKMWERKEERASDEIQIFMVTMDDLIALKTYANRKQDQDDIKLLSQLKK